MPKRSRKEDRAKGNQVNMGLHVDLKFSAAEKSAEEALVPDKGPMTPRYHIVGGMGCGTYHI